jgi:hypothetical protein
MAADLSEPEPKTMEASIEAFTNRSQKDRHLSPSDVSFHDATNNVVTGPLGGL